MLHVFLKKCIFKIGMLDRRRQKMDGWGKFIEQFYKTGRIISLTKEGKGTLV